jgi:hypothetical protein
MGAGNISQIAHQLPRELGELLPAGTP